MIKLEHVVLASPEQMEFVIEGMRNPMNSWGKSDTKYGCLNTDCDAFTNGTACDGCMGIDIGKNDIILMRTLSSAGTDHRKFMRMMPVYVRITAPLYWWKEFDTYKVGTVANSCSTMHKIQEKSFTLSDFSYEHLLGMEFHNDERDVPYIKIDNMDYSTVDIYRYSIITMLNKCRDLYLETRDKSYWWQMIQMLPSSYNQTRNVMMNYEVLANMYKSRKNHKLDEWVEFCKWIETLPYSELIMCGTGMNDNSINARQGLNRIPDTSR